MPFGGRVNVLALAKRSTGNLAINYGRKIGSREIVGPGFNGLPSYVDRLEFPFPAIRFRPDTSDIKVIIVL